MARTPRTPVPANDPPEYMGRMELMREVERLREAQRQIIDSRAVARDAVHAAETEIERLRDEVATERKVATDMAADSFAQSREVERLRAALDMAIYHADNLRNYIDGKTVRDLAESGGGLERARSVLKAGT